jgi:PAS domain S-box-containing protein
MAKNDEQSYSSFVKAISYSLKQFRLYSDNHPITKQSLIALSAELDKFFALAPKITLGSMRKLLVVNGDVVGEKDPAAQDLAKEFDRLGIEGISLEKGLSISEMISLFNLMAMRSKSLEGKGGFKAAFDGQTFPHIKLATGKYHLLEEGEVVADQENQATSKEESGVIHEINEEPALPEAPQPAPVRKVASIVDILQKVREEGAPTSQAVPAQKIEVDYEKLIVQLEKNPQEMAQLTLEDAKDAAYVEAVIRRVVKFLVEGLISFLVESGKDITKALDKLAKELEKTIGKVAGGEDFTDLKKKIPGIFEEATDELRVKMMVKTYQKDPTDAKAQQKMAGKLFKDEDVRKRLEPTLKEELNQAGMPVPQFEQMFDKVEEKIAAKKSKVTIDAEELEELRRKAKSFDSEVKKEVSKAVQKVEREKKVILDEKERVDTVIRNLAEGLLVVDKQGKVVLMNPAAERLLGINQSEKKGRPVMEGLKEEHLVAMTNGNLKDTEDNVSKRVETFSFNDETKKVLQASTAVIENEDGQTVGMVSVLSDVTKQKQFDELKTKFVANVSHELRTPLVAIHKSLSMILEKEVGEVSPEQEKFLSIAHRNIDRLSRLINDLLDVSKLEAGGMKLNLKTIVLRELIQHVISTIETWAKDKNIKLIIEAPDAVVEIQADPDRITQVLTNLAGNAIKFTPDGGSIIFDIKTGIQDPEIPIGTCIEVGVRDTGIGIAPEDQKKIFEKFEQVSLAQPAGVSSTGLGLTISKEIVELHSGKIWVESDAGKGSRFAFRIPENLHQVKG